LLVGTICDIFNLKVVISLAFTCSLLIVLLRSILSQFAILFCILTFDGINFANGFKLLIVFELFFLAYVT